MPEKKNGKAMQSANSAQATRAVSGSIKQVSVGYADNRRRILVANSDGVWAEDDVVRTRFGVNAVATGDTGMQTGSMSVGNTIGFELFDEYEVEELAREAARRAILKLNARPAPSGTMPVVIKSGGGAVVFHEACGHGLEADAVLKQASVFSGRLPPASITIMSSRCSPWRPGSR